MKTSSTKNEYLFENNFTMNYTTDLSVSLLFHNTFHCKYEAFCELLSLSFSENAVHIVTSKFAVSSLALMLKG